MKLNIQEEFENALKNAKEKQSKGLLLKSSERLALENQWFFTLPLPLNVIEKIIETAHSMNIKSSELVAAWIFKEVSKL